MVEFKEPILKDKINYQIKNNTVFECLSSQDGGSKICSPLPKPDSSFAVESVHKLNGELFAFWSGTFDGPCHKVVGRALGHYRDKAKKWDMDTFHLLDQIKPNTGACHLTTRDPTGFKEDSGYLIVQLDTNEQLRARISSNKMYFEPNSRPLNLDEETEEGLHKIAAVNNPPNMIVFARFPGSEYWGPAFLDNRWKKKQAIEFLLKKGNRTQYPKENERIQHAIDLLKTYQENDQIVFVPQEELFLTPHPYYEVVHGFTSRLLNFVPDQVELNITQWEHITAPLAKDLGSAQDEREALRETARRWKIVVGSQTGNTQDVGGWIGNIVGLVPSWIPLFGNMMGQTHCGYDSLNVFKLLEKLKVGGFLHYHKIEEADLGKWATIQGVLHNAAHLQEKETGQWYVLDSWPMGAGHLPFCMPEEDWNLLTANSLNVFPTGEAFSQTAATNRLVTGGVGLTLAALYARHQVGLRFETLTTVMPSEQIQVLHSSSLGRVFKKYFGPLRAQPLTMYKQRVGLSETGQLFVTGELLGLLPKANVGETIDKDLFRDRYFRVIPDRTPLSNPFSHAINHYFFTPRGALNFGAMILFATELMSVPFVGSPDGIPDLKDKYSPGIGEQLLVYANAGYLGAEGSLAIRAGVTPILYELPVAGLPMLAGGIGGSALAHEIGVRTDIPTLQYGGRGNMITGVAGGAAAVAGAKRLIGQSAWQAIVQDVEKAVVKNAGRAGLWLEGFAQSSVQFASQKVLPVFIGMANVVSRLVTPLLIFNPDQPFSFGSNQKIET